MYSTSLRSVEGNGCKEIRQNGPNPLPQDNFSAPCQINAAMLRAERVYRNELRKTTIAQLVAAVEEADDGSIAARGCVFLSEHLRVSTSPTPQPED